MATETEKSPSSLACSEVWEVANKTTSCLFSTEEGANRYISSFSAGVGGGMMKYRRHIIGSAPSVAARNEDQESIIKSILSVVYSDIRDAAEKDIRALLTGKYASTNYYGPCPLCDAAKFSDIPLNEDALGEASWKLLQCAGPAIHVNRCKEVAREILKAYLASLKRQVLPSAASPAATAMPDSGRAAALLAEQKKAQHYDVDEWVDLVNELERELDALNAERCDAITWSMFKARAEKAESELADANAAAEYYVREPGITPRRAMERQAAEIERLKREMAAAEPDALRWRRYQMERAGLPSATTHNQIQDGEVSAPTSAGKTSEIKPDGNADAGRSGAVGEEGGEHPGSARSDAVFAGGAECGPRPAGGAADQEERLTQTRGEGPAAALSPTSAQAEIRAAALREAAKVPLAMFENGSNGNDDSMLVDCSNRILDLQDVPAPTSSVPSAPAPTAQLAKPKPPQEIAAEWKDWIPYPDSTQAEWDRYNLAAHIASATAFKDLPKQIPPGLITATGTILSAYTANLVWQRWREVLSALDIRQP